MRKLIALSLIAISIILILSCNNHAYKVVATTVNPTAKQKALLSIACTNQFGKSEPIFLKGETIIKHDTIPSNDSALKEVIKTLPCIYNYDSLLKVIKASFKPILINTTAETTNKYVEPDKAREYFLQSQLRDKDNIISNLENDNKQKDENVKDIRHKLIIAFIGYGIELLALILFVYFKLNGLYFFSFIIKQLQTK